MMLRSLGFAALLTLAAAASAEGLGSRIRATPAGPHSAAPPASPAERDAQRCDSLTDEAKERCLRELRAAVRDKQQERAPHEGPGPESVGMGSGAGIGSTAGRK